MEENSFSLKDSTPFTAITSNTIDRPNIHDASNRSGVSQVDYQSGSNVPVPLDAAVSGLTTVNTSDKVLGNGPVSPNAPRIDFQQVIDPQSLGRFEHQLNDNSLNSIHMDDGGMHSGQDDDLGDYEDIVIDSAQVPFGDGLVLSGMPNMSFDAGLDLPLRPPSAHILSLDEALQPSLMDGSIMNPVQYSDVSNTAFFHSRNSGQSTNISVPNRPSVVDSMGQMSFNRDGSVSSYSNAEYSMSPSDPTQISFLESSSSRPGIVNSRSGTSMISHSNRTPSPSVSMKESSLVRNTSSGPAVTPLSPSLLPTQSAPSPGNGVAPGHFPVGPQSSLSLLNPSLSSGNNGSQASGGISSSNLTALSGSLSYIPFGSSSPNPNGQLLGPSYTPMFGGMPANQYITSNPPHPFHGQLSQSLSSGSSNSPFANGPPSSNSSLNSILLPPGSSHGQNTLGIAGAASPLLSFAGGLGSSSSGSQSGFAGGGSASVGSGFSGSLLGPGANSNMNNAGYLGYGRKNLGLGIGMGLRLNSEAKGGPTAFMGMHSTIDDMDDGSSYDRYEVASGGSGSIMHGSMSHSRSHSHVDDPMSTSLYESPNPNPNVNLNMNVNQNNIFNSQNLQGITNTLQQFQQQSPSQPNHPNSTITHTSSSVGYPGFDLNSGLEPVEEEDNVPLSPQANSSYENSLLVKDNSSSPPNSSGIDRNSMNVNGQLNGAGINNKFSGSGNFLQNNAFPFTPNTNGGRSSRIGSVPNGIRAYDNNNVVYDPNSLSTNNNLNGIIDPTWALQQHLLSQINLLAGMQQEFVANFSDSGFSGNSTNLNGNNGEHGLNAEAVDALQTSNALLENIMRTIQFSNPALLSQLNLNQNLNANVNTNRSVMTRVPVNPSSNAAVFNGNAKNNVVPSMQPSHVSSVTEKSNTVDLISGISGIESSANNSISNFPEPMPSAVVSSSLAGASGLNTEQKTRFSGVSDTISNSALMEDRNQSGMDPVGLSNASSGPSQLTNVSLVPSTYSTTTSTIGTNLVSPSSTFLPLLGSGMKPRSRLACLSESCLRVDVPSPPRSLSVSPAPSFEPVTVISNSGVISPSEVTKEPLSSSSGAGSGNHSDNINIHSNNNKDVGPARSTLFSGFSTATNQQISDIKQLLPISAVGASELSTVSTSSSEKVGNVHQKNVKRIGKSPSFWRRFFLSSEHTSSSGSTSSQVNSSGSAFSAIEKEKEPHAGALSFLGNRTSSRIAPLPPHLSLLQESDSKAPNYSTELPVGTKGISTVNNEGDSSSAAEGIANEGLPITPATTTATPSTAVAAGIPGQHYYPDTFPSISKQEESEKYEEGIISPSIHSEAVEGTHKAPRPRPAPLLIHPAPSDADNSGVSFQERRGNPNLKLDLTTVNRTPQGPPSSTSAADSHTNRAREVRERPKNKKKITPMMTKHGSIILNGFTVRETGISDIPIGRKLGWDALMQPQQSERLAAAQGDSTVSSPPAGRSRLRNRRASERVDTAEIPFKDCCVRVEVLGQGASGTVYKVVHVPSLTLLAAKSIPLYDTEMHLIESELSALYCNRVKNGLSLDSAFIRLMREQKEKAKAKGKDKDSKHFEVDVSVFEELRAAPCPYIVSFYDAFMVAEDGMLVFVTEYMDGGSLQDIIDSKPAPLTDRVVLANITWRVLKGLEYLHLHRLLHRDIKPANLLINHSGEVKIADFGIIKELPQGIDFAETFTGTVSYMPPERLNGKPYDSKSDVWSLGLTLLAVALGRPVFEPDINFFNLLLRTEKRDFPRLDPEVHPPEFIDLVEKMLVCDPAQRPSCTELLQHPFVVDCRSAKELRAQEAGKKKRKKRSHVVDFNAPGNSGINEGILEDLVEVVKKVQEYRFQSAVKNGQKSLKPINILKLENLANQMGLPLQIVVQLFDKAQGKYAHKLEEIKRRAEANPTMSSN